MTLPAKHYKVLIVEDNPLLNKVTDLALTRLGYECRNAASAVEALDILADYTPDIILSDYEMPGTNGFQFRQKLLQNEVWKDIPFVFLTSHSDEAMVLKGLDLHALDYIIKGTSYPVIAAKLDNIITSLQHEHERSVKELRKAAETLQVKSIPASTPSVPGFSISFWNKSYKDYPGGDFIDIIQANERYTFVLMGDIMGKKWQAWFFTFGYMSYIRSAIRLCILDDELSCFEIMQKINRVVCEDESLKDILSSLSLLLVDAHTGTVTYTGAGDLPLVHYVAETQTTRTITSSGLLLGLQQDGYFDEQTIQLAEGDKLVAFTDGVTDILQDGHKKSAYPDTVKWLAPMLAQTQGFETIRKKLEADFSGQRQIDDASIIFIEKKTK